MTGTTNLFEVELAGDTLIVTPTHDLHELDFRDIEVEATAALNLLRRSSARNVVLDLHRINCCGSTALGEFVQLWRLVNTRQGRMALCNVSEQARETLEVTNLDSIWPICCGRGEALATVRGEMVCATT
jgi:anti-anti-sigma factor